MAAEAIVKPVYQQIAIDIANRIYNGEFEVGSKIFGRSTLAGEYNVSPETIRRSIILLQDMNIVETNQGSGIEVKSRDEACKFIEKFKHMDNVNYIKNRISDIVNERKTLDEDLKVYIDKLMDFSERFKSSNPFSPFEIRITKKSKIVGKTIAESKFWQNTGATIIGIRRDKNVVLSPGPYAEFYIDDVIIAVGDEGAFERTNKYIYEK